MISTKDCFWGGFMARDYQFPAFLQCLVPSQPQASRIVFFFIGIAFCIRAAPFPRLTPAGIAATTCKPVY
jgi:hypothetical protein